MFRNIFPRHKRGKGSAVLGYFAFEIDAFAALAQTTRGPLEAGRECFRLGGQHFHANFGSNLIRKQWRESFLEDPAEELAPAAQGTARVVCGPSGEASIFQTRITRTAGPFAALVPGKILRNIVLTLPDGFFGFCDKVFFRCFSLPPITLRLRGLKLIDRVRWLF